MDSCSGLAQMCRDKLKNRKEDLVALPYDPMMRGYLALLNSIMSRLPKSELEELIHNLHRLLGTTISSENRRLLYQMLGSLDQFGLLKHLQTMIQLTPPSRSSQKR